MSFNGGFNPFRKKETAAKQPETVVESLRGILSSLDSKYGAEKVNEALSHLRAPDSTNGIGLRNLPPVSNDLYAEMERLGKGVEDKGEIVAAIIELQDERDVDFLADAERYSVNNPIDTEGANAKFEKLLPKARALSQKEIASVSELELSELIEESGAIRIAL